MLHTLVILIPGLISLGTIVLQIIAQIRGKKIEANSATAATNSITAVAQNARLEVKADEQKQTVVQVAKELKQTTQKVASDLSIQTKEIAQNLSDKADTAIQATAEVSGKADSIHKMVNGNMSLALENVAKGLERIADLTPDDPAARAAAIQARQVYEKNEARG